MKLWPCAALALSIAALAGCTTDQGMLSLAAPFEVPLDARRLDLETLPIAHDVEGTHWAVTSVLFVPTQEASLADAVADAIARGHGDILTRARVSTTKYWFLVGVEQIRVHGDVIDLRSAQ